MYFTAILAASLLVRTIAPVDGVAPCEMEPGESIAAAYTVSISPVHFHAAPTSRVERLDEARLGSVKGIPAGHSLILAVVSQNKDFDPMRQIRQGDEVFPYSRQVVDKYREVSERDYVADMMSVVVPFSDNGWNRAEAVYDLHRVIFAIWPESQPAVREFGPEDGERVLVVGGVLRERSWVDFRASGESSESFAESLGRSGFHVVFTPSTGMDGISLDANGMFVFGGKPASRIFFLHLSGREASAYADCFGGRKIKTKVFTYDSPTLVGSRAIFTHADI